MMDSVSNKNSHGNRARVIITTISVVLLIASAVLVLLEMNTGDNANKKIILIILTLFILMLVVLIIITQRFFSSLAMINKSAKIIAGGNLNVSDILLEKTKGLENLTIAFNDMKSNFLSFIELTKGNIITLSGAIEQVSGNIDVSYQGNEQIALNMNSIAEMAQQQMSLVKDTIDSLESSSSRIEKITASINQIEKNIEDTVHTTNDGTLNMNNFYDQLENISGNLDSTYAFVNQLNQEISKITEISAFIIQVSGQLKLLGLNASIEAARAGEAGRSFSIVAKEIGDLSSKTQESIQEINTIVEEVNKRSEDVNQSIGSFIQNFKDSKAAFNTVQESFDAINTQSEKLNKEIKEIYNEINQVSSATIETKGKGIELQKASDEISSQTQSVAAVTQEALAGLEEITNNTNSLNEMLSGIRNLVKRFNTSVSPVQHKSSQKRKIGFISLDKSYGFWDTVFRGAVYAKKELEDNNTYVDLSGYIWNNDMEKNVLAKMREYIDQNYDGIALNGLFSQTIPLIEEARRKGIPVALFNCDFEQKSSRIAYFAPNIEESATVAGKLMAKALNDSGKALIAIPKVDHVSKVYNTRRDAIQKQIGKYKKIHLDAVDINDDDNGAYEAVKSYISSHKDVRGVFIIGQGIIGAARAIDDLGLSGKVRIIGFDHSKEIFDYIKKDIIYAAIGQDPFGQGHDPIIWLYNLAETGEKLPSESMWSRLDIVDRNNVNDVVI